MKANKTPFSALIIATLLATVSHNSHADQPLFCQDYVKQVAGQLRQNEKQNCHFSGLRWSKNLINHKHWCNNTNQSVAKSELRYRQRSLIECTWESFALDIPVYGTTETDFIPRDWEIIKKSAYKHIKLAKAPIDGIINVDFNRDGKSDKIFLIGKRVSSQTIFERFALLILETTDNGYKRQYLLERGFTDELAAGAGSRSKLEIEYFAKRLSIVNWRWYDRRERDANVRYDFIYKYGRFMLDGYSEMETERTYAVSSDEVPQSLISYDFGNQFRLRYDNTTDKLLDDKTKLLPWSIPRIDLLSLDNFEGLRLEEDYRLRMRK